MTQENQPTVDNDEPYYRGPYVLMRDARSGSLRFVPVKRVDDEWVPLSQAEIEAQIR